MIVSISLPQATDGNHGARVRGSSIDAVGRIAQVAAVRSAGASYEQHAARATPKDLLPVHVEAIADAVVILPDLAEAGGDDDIIPHTDRLLAKLSVDAVEPAAAAVAIRDTQLAVAVVDHRALHLTFT